MTVLIHRFELTDNWEDTIFPEVAYWRGEETNVAGEKGASEDEINEPLSNVPEIASYQEATSGLHNVLHFLETNGNMKINSQKLLLMYKVIGLSKGEASRSSQTF